jgi:NAD(P)-dependent dehydrogenase (short-subunit alcohol dehydrogenase family)
MDTRSPIARVHAVARGPIQTDMLDRFTGGNEDAKSGFLASLPAHRAGTPEEIAQTVAFLASDKARFLTGQCLAVDGGFTAQ